MYTFRSIIPMPPIARGDALPHRQSLVGALLSTNRGVLGLGLLFSLSVPELFHSHSHGVGPWFSAHYAGVEPTFVASFVAIILAHLFLRRVSMLPLISAKSLILPTFIMSYSLVTAALYMTQYSFGRYHLIASCFVAIAWYFLVTILRGRVFKPTLGVIGALDGVGDYPNGNINWLPLTRPRLEERMSAVVVDPHASLDLNWSHFITGLVLDGIPVYHRTHLDEGMLGRVRFQSHADNNFGALLPSLGYLRAKRFIDLGILLITLPIVLPLLILAAIAVKLDSRGPVLFRQTRMGHRGRPFTCYKLRSMYVDGDGPSFTIEDDPRVTRVGRIIRKWRIDELPQVLNILKGEMSWIGPRPEALALALEYEAHVPFYAYRHAVRPGITGWAAVHQGNVAEVEAARIKLEYDFYYIKYFSIWLDVLIGLKTIQTVCTGFGSR